MYFANEKESKDEWGPSSAPSRQGQRQRQGLELWSLAALQSPPRQVPCMGIIQKEAFAPAHSCSRSYSDTLRKWPEQLGCLTSFCKIVSVWFQWLCLWVCDKFITVPVLFCSPQKTRGWEMFQQRNPVPQEEKGGTRLVGDDRQRNPRDPRIGCGYLATSEQETQLLLASKHPVTTWSSSLLYLLLKLAFIPNQNPEPSLFWLFSLLSFLHHPFFSSLHAKTEKTRVLTEQPRHWDCLQLLCYCQQLSWHRILARVLKTQRRILALTGPSAEKLWGLGQVDCPFTTSFYLFIRKIQVIKLTS